LTFAAVQIDLGRPGRICFHQAVSDLTRILHSIEQDDPNAAEKLLPLVYDELRKLAAVKISREAPGQTGGSC
jgi:plasmid stabilization system protein ParE